MNHEQFKKKMKKSESDYFVVSLMVVMFLWVVIMAAFLTESWTIVFLIGGLITIWQILATTYVAQTYEGYLFLSYCLDEVLKKVNKKGKKNG